MNDLNKFFKTLSSRPTLMWRFIASVLFIGLAFAVFFVPSFGFGGSIMQRNIFAGLWLIYGLYRFYTFYNEYKREEE